MLSQVLSKVHEDFFAAKNAAAVDPASDGGLPAVDVRPILAAMRRRLLEGVQLVFSAVYPRVSATSADTAARDFYWRLAEQVLVLIISLYMCSAGCAIYV